jgi:hypothetical protein
MLLALSSACCLAASAATVTAKGGKVTVLLAPGDAVTIADGGAGQVQITGHGDTLVNGESTLTGVPLTGLLVLKGAKDASFTVICTGLTNATGITCQGAGESLALAIVNSTVGGDLKVAMKGPDCYFSTHGTSFAGDVQVKAGPGSANVMLGPFTIGGKLTVSTGPGADNVFLNEADIAGKVTLATGSGDDYISFVATQAGGLAVKQQDGVLNLVMGSFDIGGPLTVASGKGHAEVAIADGVIAGPSKATFGPGTTVCSAERTEFQGKTALSLKADKRIEFRSSAAFTEATFGSDCRLNGSALGDLFLVEDSTHLAGKFELRGLAGDDSFVFAGNTLDGQSARLDGGAGNDTLYGGQPGLTVVNVETEQPE